MKKGQVWISAVLYILIAAVAMVIILQAGIPILNNMKDRTSFSRTRDAMVGIDRQIVDVAAEGEGSQRVVPIDISQGQLVIEDTVKWEIETSTKILEPSTKIELGNVIVYTNIDVSSDDDVNCGPPPNEESEKCYLLENSLIGVLIKKQETSAEMSTSEIIKSITLKESGEKIEGGFEFSVGGEGKSGDIWTEIIPEGENTRLDKAFVIVHFENPDLRYDLKLTLESEADFLKSEIQSLERLS